MIALPTNPVLPKIANHSRREQGFSLVELTIVLIIVALLSSGLILGISSQRSAAEHADVQHQLENIREALLGYAIVYGRLPCPAKADLPNTDANSGLAILPPCDKNLQHGVLPWKTLGLPEVDPWGNRFTYFASSRDNSITPIRSFTNELATGTLASFTLDTPGNANVKESTSAGSNIASELPAIIISHGGKGAGAYQSNGAQLTPSAYLDEKENSDGDTDFIAHTPDENFDDHVVWIVPSILKSRMVAAGRLP